MFEFLKRLFAPARAASQPGTVPELAGRRPSARRPPARPPNPPASLEDLLRALKSDRKTLPVPTAVELICRACDLLCSDHEPLAGLRPCDLRFTTTGSIFIATTYPFSPLRRDRGLRGSLSHMSPEQVMGRELDERSDVFNLAVVLHESLTGERLFAADSDFGVLEAARAARLPPRPQVIPLELHDVLRRALALNPQDRFQTVKELRSALGPFCAGSSLPELFNQLVAARPVVVEPPPSTPLQSGEEGERLVYADWLEEHGKPDEASWLRQESELRSLKGAALAAALRRLSDLSKKVGTAFMASVARPAVEGCPVRVGFKCPMKWEALQRTEREDVRHCVGCQQDVRFVRTMEEAQQIAMREGCVALDPSLVRAEGDLDPHPAEGAYVGRLA